MDYCILEQMQKSEMNNLLVTKEKNIVICSVDDISSIEKLDFIQYELLISDELKALFETYVPDIHFTPYGFMDMENSKDKMFWQGDFETFDFEDIEGLDESQKLPMIFIIRINRSVKTLAIHLSVSESIFRRAILGLKIVRLTKA